MAALGCGNEDNADPERTQMTFEMVRLGWPNTAAILALAVMPIVALTAMADRRPQTAQVQPIESVAICLTLAECTAIAAMAEPETILE